MWVLGMDAGGTKAHCALAGENAVIVAEGFGGPSNYQIVGEQKTEESLHMAIEETMKQAQITKREISCAVFGMSGADEEADFEILYPMAKRLLGNIPIKIVHDSWIGMRSVTKDMTGIVSICGTGAGHSGRNHKGEELTLRNLFFELGNMGGGIELVGQALHYAFRSNEGTFQKTILEEKMPNLFGVSDMDQLCQKIRKEGIEAEQRFQIPVLVAKAANEGDQVAIMLLEQMGYEEGLYGSGIVKRLGMEKETFPVVLIGALFQKGSTIMADAYMRAIKETAPLAYSIIPKVAPVSGAIGMALDWWQEISLTKIADE